MKKLLIVLIAALALAAWWLLFDARAPGSAAGEFDIAAYRALIAEDVELPTAIEVEIISEDEAPRFAVETGGGFGKFRLHNTGVRIVSVSATTVIGGAVDEPTFLEHVQSKEARFFPDAFKRLQDAYPQADQVLITHEHFDHVMAITRHPAPESFAAKLKLTAAQISALPAFGPEGGLSPALRDLPPTDFSRPTRIAPGVVVAPSPGHTPGSQIFFVRRDDSREYLFVGDIVWALSNIETLKTRPRLLQYIFFDPPEDRKAILRQVRALHDIVAEEPGLIIVSEHDGANIEALIADGSLQKGFN